MNNKIDAISFDLDGTLYNHNQYVTAGFKRVSKIIKNREGVEIYDDLIKKYYYDEEYEKTFNVVLEKYGIPTETLPKFIREYHDKIGNLNTYCGIKALLEELSEDNMLAIVSDGKNVRAKISETKIDDYFCYVMSTQDHNFTKNVSKPFDDLLEYLGVKANSVLYVGNDPRVGFEHPNRLGMYTIWLRKGIHADNDPERYSVPNFQINTISGLKKTIKRL